MKLFEDLYYLPEFDIIWTPFGVDHLSGAVVGL